MPRREELEKRIRRTGKNWTLTQYMFASMAIFVVVTGAMLAVRAPMLMAGLIGLMLSLGLPYFVVGQTINRRVKQFNARFPDAIDLLVRGLKSGLPVTETFQVVSQELPGPVGEEFKGVIERIRIGNTMEAALQESANMLGTPGIPVFLHHDPDPARNRRQSCGNAGEPVRRAAQARTNETQDSRHVVGSKGLRLYRRRVAFLRLWRRLVDESRLSCGLLSPNRA